MNLIIFIVSLILIAVHYALGPNDVKTKQTFQLASPIAYTTLFDHDLHQSIEKLAQENWAIRNDTDHEVTLILKGVYVDDTYGTAPLKETTPQEIIINTHKTISAVITPQETLDKNETNNKQKKIIIKDVQFKFDNIPFFLNLENKGDGYKIVVHKERTPSFPQALSVSSFMPHLLDETRATAINIPSPQIPSGELCLNPNNVNDYFIKVYNLHISYLFETLLPQENINKQAYFDKLTHAYQINSLEKMIALSKDSKFIDTVKVPPIIHTLWFTSEADPKELPERYIYWLKKSIEACPREHGFSHWFWVHDKTKLPKTIKALEDLNVVIHETTELGDFPMKDLYDQELKNKRFGRVSDIFRLVVLDKFGGVYRDTDYRIHQSLLPLLTHYDFVAAREPWWHLISNALIISCPGHPMIRKAMDIIQRNCHSTSNPIPTYLQYEIDQKKETNVESKWYTVFMTGPGIFFPVIDQGFNQKGYTDIILPHPYLQPSYHIAFPQPDHLGWQQPVPLPAYGVHYFEGAWTPERSKEFGSRG